jgi:hypothetical protein
LPTPTWPHPFIGHRWLLIIVSFVHLNLFNKCSTPPSAFYPLLRLPPSSVAAPSPSLYRGGHFWQWITCWRRGLVYQRHRGGCIFILLGAFRTMEHLLATRVSLPASPLSVRQSTIIFFYIGIWRWRVGPTLFALNWNLLPSNIRAHKQHQENRK